MYNRASALILRWLKVPPEPHPPFGDPASLRVFRAGRNFYNLRLFGWGIGQVVAFAGIIFWLVVFLEIEGTVLERRRAGAVPARPTDAKSFKESMQRIGAGEETGHESPAIQPAGPARPEATPASTPAKKLKRGRGRIDNWAAFKRTVVEFALILPLWAFPVLWTVKILGLVIYLVQLPLTYAVRRLDYEMRWYVVTDRSLRIRTGVWNVQEITMSFANLQQVEVTQGPLQRLLGLADVKVQSAGGSDSRSEGRHGAGDSLHTGHFHGVDNATEIRDLVLDRLKRYRESGLGDPEEARHAPPAPPGPAGVATAAAAGADDLLLAARELATEARALRVALG